MADYEPATNPNQALYEASIETIQAEQAVKDYHDGDSDIDFESVEHGVLGALVTYQLDGEQLKAFVNQEEDNTVVAILPADK